MGLAWWKMCQENGVGIYRTVFTNEVTWRWVTAEKQRFRGKNMRSSTVYFYDYTFFWHNCIIRRSCTLTPLLQFHCNWYVNCRTAINIYIAVKLKWRTQRNKAPNKNGFGYPTKTGLCYVCTCTLYCTVGPLWCVYLHSVLYSFLIRNHKMVFKKLLSLKMTKS